MDVVSSIVSAIQLIIKAAPSVISAAAAIKDFITNLFGSGVIDKATQDALHAHVDAVATAMLTGRELPQWTVEPDPTS